MKPKLLDPWTLGRVSAPDKASTKFFFSKLIYFCLNKTIYILAGDKPWTYTSTHGRDMGDPSDETLSKR